MPRFDPLFGKVSFEKAAKFIAIFDVVIVCVYILAQYGGGGAAYEEKSEKYESDLSKAVSPNENVNVHDKLGVTYHPMLPSTTTTTTESTIGNDSVNGSDPASDPTSRSHPPIFLITFDDYQKLNQESMPSTEIIIILGVFAIIIGFAHICFEIWLCRLLLKASAHKDGSALKIWFWCKLGLAVVFTLYGIIGIMTMKMDVTDWIDEFINIYRFYALYIIFDYKSHISACVQIVKPRETA